MPDSLSEASAVDLPGRIHSQIPDGTGDGNHNQPSPEGGIRTISMGLPNPPAFLRRSFGSKVQAPSRKSPQLLNLFFAFIATKKRFMVDFWRRHFAQGVSKPRTERLVRRVGGAAFAFLSLLVVVTCVGAAIIPLPSQLTEKVPKLLGAKFTTRNGAIIIVKKDSRQVDAVLAPN